MFCAKTYGSIVGVLGISESHFKDSDLYMTFGARNFDITYLEQLFAWIELCQV